MKTKTRDAVNAFIERNKHALLLLYFMIYLPWFGHLERTVTTHFHVIHVALDDYIPFCEYLLFHTFYGLDMLRGDLVTSTLKIKTNISVYVPCCLPE